MRTRPRQSIGTRHPQVPAAVPTRRISKSCSPLGVWVILIAESSLHSWPWLFDCLNMTWYSLFSQVVPVDLLLHPKVATSNGITLKATSLPYRKRHSLTVAGMKLVFQGKLCFPPLPSTVFYRITSSFIPLNTERHLPHQLDQDAGSFPVPTLHILPQRHSGTRAALWGELKYLYFFPHPGF